MKRLLVEGFPGKCLQNAQLNGIPLIGNNANGSMGGPSCIKTAEIFNSTQNLCFLLFWD